MIVMARLRQHVLPLAVAAAVTVSAIAGLRAQQVPALPDPRLEEARQAYEATNYESARDLLDGMIARISASGVADPGQRQLLASSYELRGRARLNLRDVEGARTDFRAMLLLEPGLALPAQVGPRALTLFDEVRKTTVGQVEIAVTPTDAVVTLDGVRLVERPTALTLVAGTHTVAATRSAHRAASQSFTVVPGAPPQVITLMLEREFSTLTLSTAPANVEVLIDGASRGFTEADPSAAAQAGVGTAAVSKPFLLEELQAGRHRLELRRDCFITVEQSLDVARPDDLKLDVVRLAPAVASVAVSSDAPGGTIFVDDAPRGAPPQVLDDVCQGPHTFEVRTRAGRHLKRLDLKPGQKETFVAQVRPAFAIVSDSGANQGVRGGPDLRIAAEAAFQETRTLTLYASPEKRTTDLLAADQLPADWLAFDTLRRPMGGAGKLGEPARRDIGTRLSRTLDAQGIAAIARDPSGDRSDMLLILLAPGSAKPDVLRWRLDNPASIRQAATRLDQVPSVTRASLGMLAVDVLEVQGAVVASVDAGGGAAAAGLQPGDVITSAGGTQLNGAAHLMMLVNAQPAGQPLSLDLRDRMGVVKKVDVTAQRVPRLVELLDQTVLSNALAVHYASRAYSAATPLDEAAIRLNLAGALMRIENWGDATRELEAVAKIAAALPPPVKDAVGGTAQYLLGACAEAVGDVAGAERAWGAAAQSSSALLTDSGEPLKELADRRLAQLRQARGLAR